MTLQNESRSVATGGFDKSSLIGGLDNREIARKFVSAQAAYDDGARFGFLDECPGDRELGRYPKGYQLGISASLTSALKLGEWGLPCFPCRADKRPATPRGFKDATCDRNVVREVWMRYPGLLTESTHVAPSESINPLARRIHRGIGPIGLMKAMDSVPKRYLAAWGQFQCQCPDGVTEQTWRQAIDDAGRFLAQWGKLADSFGWSPGDVFDVPRDCAMGLVWWLKGRTVSALGPEHACVGQPAYDRVTRRDWVNPYARPVRPVSLSPILGHQQRIMQRVLGR